MSPLKFQLEKTVQDGQVGYIVRFEEDTWFGLESTEVEAGDALPYSYTKQAEHFLAVKCFDEGGGYVIFPLQGRTYEIGEKFYPVLEWKRLYLKMRVAGKLLSCAIKEEEKIKRKWGVGHIKVVSI